MHWLKNSNSPSSSSSSSSHSPKSTNSHLNSKHWVISDIKHFRNTNRGPRLTRSRKLRHVSDLNFANLKIDGSDSRDSYHSSESSTTVSRSASNLELRYEGLEQLALHSPLPLPHPRAAKNLGGETWNSPPASESFPLPSPQEASNTDQLGLDGPADRSSSRYASPRFQNQVTGKNLEQIEARTNESASDRGRIFVPKIGDYEDETWNVVPRRFWGAAISAPASAYSSPILSPRKLSNGNFVPHVPNCTYEPNGCFPRDLSSAETILNSLDRYTIPSPPIRSPSPKSKHPSAPSSPLHPSLSTENSLTWHENNGNINAQPLPLPPGPSSHSKSSFIYQHTLNTNPDVSPISNQWQKGKLIGSGSFGSVYVATHRETGALCAIKEVNLIRDDPKSAECMQQLEQEIKVLRLLKHQNIVQYYGSEITEDHFYIYLEYVHPGSIYNYIRNHGLAITEAVVRNFTRHILSGLAYLHSTKTVHRDIKGANLLVNTSGVVKLADFGLAKHLSGPATPLSMKGSPHWMAPEIILSTSSGYDTSVDIWSLGCTVIEMYTGKAPWGELPQAAAMFNILKKEPPIPETLSAEGKDFLFYCLRKNPAERPSAQKLLEHPFVRQTFPGRSPMDTQPSPRQHPRFILNMPPVSPTSRSMERKQFSQGDNSSSNNNGHSPEKSNSAALLSRHSPRSTLETFPSVSPPHSNHGSTRYPTPLLAVSNRFHPTSPGRDWTRIIPK